MIPEVLLIFGPPGVGKTSLINQFVLANPTYVRISAGSLIDQGITEAERDRLRLMEKNSILANQEVLVNNFKEYIERNKGKRILFDGHCLINNNNELIEVPLHIIEQLYPKGIIFINDSPDKIIARRKQDVTRPMRSLERKENLEGYIQKSVAISQKYSKALNIPIRIINSDFQEFKAAVNSI